jgi:5-formyltetrahydrofolate cyclo-ligase
MNEREEIRQETKTKRAALSDAERKIANHQIAQRIINSEIFKQSQKIACYMAVDAEVDLQEVIEAILSTQMLSSRGLTAGSSDIDSSKVLDSAVKPRDDDSFCSTKHCYLPLVRHDRPSHLYFVEYSQDDQLQPGNFGILEPAFDPQKIIEPNDLDLVLMPLVAFDAHGNRLGTGGGYYDRTFAQASQPLLIGVAFSCQEVPQIEAQSWDIKLHGVVSEKGFRMF